MGRTSQSMHAALHELERLQFVVNPITSTESPVQGLELGATENSVRPPRT